MIFALATTLLSITLTVPESAQTRGQELHLGSVVRIEGANESDAARLSAIVLGYTPSPGYSRVLTRDEITVKVRAALPGIAIDVVGFDRCRVEAETQVVRGDWMRSDAAAALRGALVGHDATVASDGSMPDLVVPSPEAKLELRSTPDMRGLRSGAVRVPVQVWIDGAPYQTVQATFRVELFEKLPVLTGNVRRGEALAQNSVEMRRMRVDAGVQGEPLSFAAIPGATALHDLTVGAIVTDRNVQRAQLVKRGDVVQIQVRKGAIVAHATATALQDGFLGDKVRVTTTDTKRELNAVVVGRGNVEVELSNGQ